MLHTPRKDGSSWKSRVQAQIKSYGEQLQPTLSGGGAKAPVVRYVRNRLSRVSIRYTMNLPNAAKTARNLAQRDRTVPSLGPPAIGSRVPTRSTTPTAAIDRSENARQTAQISRHHATSGPLLRAWRRLSSSSGSSAHHSPSSPAASHRSLRTTTSYLTTAV